LTISRRNATNRGESAHFNGGTVVAEAFPDDSDSWFGRAVSKRRILAYRHGDVVRRGR
jgi:hypothetical protein